MLEEDSANPFWVAIDASFDVDLTEFRLSVSEQWCVQSMTSTTTKEKRGACFEYVKCTVVYEEACDC